MSIRISLGTKFQLKLTILILIVWTKLTQKGHFRSKKGKIALVRASMVVTCHVKLSARGPTDSTVF